MELFSWTSTAALLGCQTGGGNSGEGRTVLVLGGGLAGLSAAYELQKEGFTVTVLEGRDRVGGRVWTVREPFEDGMFAEIGAIRIGSTHLNVIKYAEEFGLELTEFTDGKALYFIDGQRFLYEEGQPWPVQGLNPDELNEDLDALKGRYVYDHIEEFGDPSQGEFPKGVVEKYDGMAYSDYLKFRGASDAFVELYASDNGSEVFTIGALAWMMAEAIDYDWTMAYHIRGGNDRLPNALAEAVGMDNILLGHKVTKIGGLDAEQVEITVEHGGEQTVMTADYVVCTLPFTMLRSVTVDPQFPADKVDTIANAFLMNVGRGYVQTKTRFWEAEGLGGRQIAKTNSPVERYWDLSSVQDGDSEKGMIVSYTMDKRADAYCGLSQEEREEYTMTHTEPFFPQIRAERVAFFHYCWREDEWSLGGWTDTLPNRWSTFAIARRTEGRVHFAGEHTSAWAGWMEGGVESGMRAAREIVERAATGAA
jgi:monoamine oxidase